MHSFTAASTWPGNLLCDIPSCVPLHTCCWRWCWSPDAGHLTLLLSLVLALLQAQLLIRLQRDADAKASAAAAAEEAGGEGPSGGADEAQQLAGMKQEELVQWYLMEQINRWGRGWEEGDRGNACGRGGGNGGRGQ